MKTTTITPGDDGRYRASVVAALLAAHERESARPPSPLGASAPVRGEGARVSFFARVRRSSWAPAIAKGAGVLLALVVLALVGVWADPRPRAGPPASVAAVSSGESPAEPSASAPSVTAPVDVAPPPTPAAADPPLAGVLADGRVVLNVATEDELTKLPHVGPKRAKDIVALRQRLGGRFRAITDLLRVRGLGRKTLGKIAPKVVLDAPKDASPPPS